MRHTIPFMLLLLFASCINNKDKEIKTDTTLLYNYDTAVMRSVVKKSPVAFFKEPIVNSNLQGVFSVDAYETKNRYAFLLKIRYAEFYVTDTLRLPNFGKEIKPSFKKGKADNSCILGFYDNKNQFQEYKLISFANDRLKIKVLRRFAVYTYRDKM